MGEAGAHRYPVGLQLDRRVQKCEEDFVVLALSAAAMASHFEAEPGRFCHEIRIDGP
jgi:hypothetical protein